jgi:hypothetical protein
MIQVKFQSFANRLYLEICYIYPAIFGNRFHKLLSLDSFDKDFDAHLQCCEIFLILRNCLKGEATMI